ncbi:MAG: hypothetical protein QOJ62_2164, partial [Actinomycetota bacterium]|nr:hypothetical protein [Actinomycetota bacterium]
MARFAVATVGGVRVACPSLVDPGSGSGALPSAPPALPLMTRVRAVVRCEAVERVYPGIGSWQVQLAEVADAGVGPLLDELRRPSDVRPNDLACTLELRGSPWFVVITRDGLVITPAIPLDPCGKPRLSAIAAIGALPYRAVDAVRVGLIASPESLSTGCAQGWKDMVAFEANQRPRSTPGTSGSVADLASPPASVRVCLYKAGAPEGGLRTGELVNGVTQSGDAAAVIASEAAIVGPIPAGCQDATTFAVIAAQSYLEM